VKDENQSKERMFKVQGPRDLSERLMKLSENLGLLMYSHFKMKTQSTYLKGIEEDFLFPGG